MLFELPVWILESGKKSDAETAVYLQKWVSALAYVAGLPEENYARVSCVQVHRSCLCQCWETFKIQAEFHCQIPDLK